VESPLIGACLASYGAQVIKVESSLRYDQTRIMPPFFKGMSRPDNSFHFSAVNPGKLSITLNLNHPRGKEIAKKIVKWADIVIESFTTGTMEKWGLGYKDLKKENPNIIMMSSPIYGQTGPFARHPGIGSTLVAVSGIADLTGWPDQPPQQPGFVYADFVAYRFGLLTLISALDYRRRTGKGQYIDASQFEAIVHTLTPVFLDCFANKRAVGRIGNRSTYAAPHGVYRCKGEYKYCAITVFSDEEWKDFSQVIGKPKWTESSDFSTLLNRIRNVEKLDMLVEEWTMNFTPEEVVELMQKAGVTASRVQNAEDIDKDPQLRSRQFFWEVDHPVLGTVTLMGWPLKMSKATYEMSRSPCMGEHNYDVYTKIVGLSDEEFVQFMEEGIFD
jgi:benzylsuccinate CoA-transferase BbsF subunit